MSNFSQKIKDISIFCLTIVSDLIVDGISRGEFREDIDPEAVAAALVGTWDALFLQAWFDPTFDPLEISQKFLTVVIQGLTKS